MKTNPKIVETFDGASTGAGPLVQEGPVTPEAYSCSEYELALQRIECALRLPNTSEPRRNVSVVVNYALYQYTGRNDVRKACDENSVFLRNPRITGKLDNRVPYAKH